MTHIITIIYEKELRLWSGACDNCHDYYGNRQKEVVEIWAKEKEERDCSGEELLQKMLEGMV